MPKGFTVKLAAAEPDVVQPIAMAIDDRGRLWIAEAHNYPLRAPEGKGRDRILIFEDTDGDGTLDRRKVFIENLNLVSGMESRLRRRVGRRRAEPAVHPDARTATTCRTGPPRSCSTAGATRTRTRRSTPSRGDRTAGSTAATACSPTRTSASPARRTQSASGSTARSGGITRPAHDFEVFAEGTSNPWGVDFNDYGHAFTTRA